MQKFILKPWHLVVLFLASQFNRAAYVIIEYLHTENQICRENLGKGCAMLSDAQRRWLDTMVYETNIHYPTDSPLLWAISEFRGHTQFVTRVRLKVE